MKITKEIIKALDPCIEGYEWYLENGTEDLKETLFLVNDLYPQWARWLYTRLMSVDQRREFAVIAAEKVLPIFEKRYPKDSRPRECIEATKAYLINPSAENSETLHTRRSAAYAAADAAAYAAYTAADVAAYAAYDAASAADAAAYAAYAVDATYAVDAACTAADVAAYTAARKKMQLELISTAVEILDRK